MADDTSPNLVPEARRLEILRRLRREDVVKVRALADSLAVHEMTIRRDLELLAREGRLERVYGGARLKQQAAFETSYQVRSVTHRPEKERIAEAALALVDEGDTLAFDASTTALALLQRLRLTRGLAILTSLDSANAAADAGLPFLLVGGVFHASARSFVGGGVGAQLSTLHPDKLFFSAKGFTPSAGFTDAHLPEVEAKEALIRAAALRVALLDHSKFGFEALATFARTTEVHVLVTDREPEAPFRKALELAKVLLVVAVA